MKRFILFVILVAVVPIGFSQQGWTEVASSDESSIGFDADSVLLQGNTRLVWVITVSKAGPFVGTYVLSRRWFNCTARTYGIRTTIVRSSATHQTLASYQQDENQFANDVVPGSMLDAVLVAVC